MSEISVFKMWLEDNGVSDTEELERGILEGKIELRFFFGENFEKEGVSTKFSRDIVNGVRSRIGIGES